MCGALVAAGTSITIAVPADAAGGDAPFTLLARTVERTTWPPSAVVALYVVAVAPEMLTQLVPVGEQRCHLEGSEGAPPVHVPAVVVGVWFTAGFPVTAGRVVLRAVGSQ